jgi:hypothetical protein
MPDREEPPYPAGYRPVPEDDWREQTTPGLAPVQGPGATALYGSPGHRRPDVDRPGPAPASYEQPAYAPPGAPAAATAPDYSDRPVAVRRADPLAALALLLAGIAAAVSLLLHWLSRSDQTGWTLVRDGLRDPGGLFGTGLWQPVAIVLGGGLLFVLGLLLLVPARAHRTLGLLALLVTAAVGAGVLVPLADANWRLGGFDVGFYCAIAVAGLGLLGSLKALLTGPRMRP